MRSTIELHEAWPQSGRRDLLRLPLVGRFLKWRHSRVAMQSVLLILAAMMLFDGFTGSQIAPRNLATVAAWVHYRGFIVLALLLVGNLFCMACPFMIPRALGRRLKRATRRWPKALRSKWLAIGGLVLILWVYEGWNLWASPWLTAWLIVAYFAAAFAAEALFKESAFCKYVCPLGLFNFLHSTVSPTQITSKSAEVCKNCAGHECVNGSATSPGCGLQLYVPAMKTSMDCTLCLDCVHACPYDNVALQTRPWGWELWQQGWGKRLDWAALPIVATFAALMNAFGMVPPVFELQAALARALGTASKPVIIGILFAVGMLALPALAAISMAWLSRLLGERPTEPLRENIIRFAYAFVPVSFAIWATHYLFHFLTGGLTLIPVLQDFFWTRGIGWLGAPDWAIGTRVPATDTIFIVQAVLLYMGLFGALAIGYHVARGETPRAKVLDFLPWGTLLVVITTLTLWIYTLPMEMRGSILMGA